MKKFIALAISTMFIGNSFIGNSLAATEGLKDARRFIPNGKKVVCQYTHDKNDGIILHIQGNTVYMSPWDMGISIPMDIVQYIADGGREGIIGKGWIGDTAYGFLWNVSDDMFFEIYQKPGEESETGNEAHKCKAVK